METDADDVQAEDVGEFHEARSLVDGVATKLRPHVVLCVSVAGVDAEQQPSLDRKQGTNTRGASLPAPHRNRNYVYIGNDNKLFSFHKYI